MPRHSVLVGLLVIKSRRLCFEEHTSCEMVTTCERYTRDTRSGNLWKIFEQVLCVKFKFVHFASSCANLLRIELRCIRCKNSYAIETRAQEIMSHVRVSCASFLSVCQRYNAREDKQAQLLLRKPIVLRRVEYSRTACWRRRLQMWKFWRSRSLVHNMF